MKIEKTDCSYQVTECDLKHGEQITLDGELLIPISVIDKIRAEIETKYGQCDICEYDAISGWEQVSDIADILQIIDKYKAESEG